MLKNISNGSVDGKAGTVIWPVIVVCLLTLIGFYLRVHNLGLIGFHGDEDLVSLAVKAILEHGYPLLPSGMIYPRSIVLHYIMVVSVKLFGPNEFALRLPVAIFGTALIPLSYLIANRFYGRIVGIMVAAMLCLSFHEIEIARYARMYAPFAFFYALTVYAFYNYYVIDRQGPRWIVLFLAIFTLSLHKLGFSLAFMFLIPFLFKDRRVISKSHLILNFSSLAGAFFVIERLQIRLYSRPRFLPLAATAGPDIAPNLEEGIVGSIVGVIMKMLNYFRIPSPDALIHLVETHLLISALLILTMAVLIVAVLWGNRGYWSLGQQMLTGLILVFCFLQQFNAAFLLFFLFAYSYRKGLLAFREKPVVMIATFIAVSFILWFFYVYFALKSNNLALLKGSTHFRQSVKILTDYPTFRFVWAYFMERPLLSLAAGFGFLFCFHAAAREKPDQKALFLILMYIGPLLLNGLMKSSYQLFRYSIHVDIFYLTLAALGAISALIVLKQIFLGRETHLILDSQEILRFQRIHWMIMLPVLCFIALIDLNPAKAWLSAEGGYSIDKRWSKYFSSEPYADFKTTSRYILDHMRPDDLVIAVLTTREYYNYLGKLDYWVGTGIYDSQTYLDGKTVKDLYVAVPQIKNVYRLREVLEGNNGRRKWLLASSAALHATSYRNLPAPIVDYIRSLQEKVVYIGNDQKQQVYLIE